MIAKLKSGSGFVGLIDYANDIENKNTNIIASEGVAVSSPKAMAATMHLQARSNPKVKNYVGHCMLSFSPKDTARLPDSFVEQIAKDYMQRMGIVNTQFAIYRHHDQPHGHVHIVYNRVDNNGEMMKHDTNYNMSVAIAAKMTREYGLTFGKGKKDVRRERLYGKDAVKYQLYDAIFPLLSKVTSLDQLRRELEKLGISMNMYYTKDGKARGISFSDGKVSMSGSKIDKTLGYGAVLSAIRDNAQAEESRKADYRKWATNHFAKPTLLSAADSNGTNQDIVTGIPSEVEEIVDSIEDTASDFNSAASSIGEAMVAAVSGATEIQPSIGGGGGSSKLDDDDEENKKNKYKPRRRR